MHDVVIVGVPSIAILAGILFNRSDLNTFRAEMNGRFDRVDDRLSRVDDRFDRIEKRLDRIDDDLKVFYNVAGKLEGRIESLEKK